MKEAKRELVISPAFESIGDLAPMMTILNLYRDQGFHQMEAMKFKRRHFSQVLAFFEKQKGHDRKQLRHEYAYNVSFSYRGAEFRCFTRYDYMNVTLIICTNGDNDVLIDLMSKVPASDVGGDRTYLDLFYYYMSVRNGLSSRDISINVEDFPIIYDGLYPDIDIKELVRQYSNANEPILMLYGEPGVGKTTFVKYMIAHGGFKKASYIKDPRVMEDGELWGQLTAEEFDLVIFDDLDIDLVPRSKNEKGTFMTQLLSYSDGIFTQGKVKIIITTNQTVKEIDSALVRPGRCFDFIKLNPLKKTEARDLWVNTLELSEQSFDTLFADSVLVTQAALMSEAYRVRTAIGHRSYVKHGDNKYTLEDKLQRLGIKASNGQGSASF